MDLIAYHNNCPDGWTAAFIAKLRYPEAELMPRDHGLEPPYEEVKDKDVLVVDFSWRTREQNDRLFSLAKSFRILDHHATAKDVLDGATYAVFDMERSGAGLAWDYLFGVDSLCSEDAIYRPWWVNYVEDRDLWRFKLWQSKEVNDFIMTFPYTMDGWAKMREYSVLEAANAGKHVKLQVDKYVREAAKQAQDGNLNIGDKHYTVKIVNIPYLNTSEVGNELAQTADIGLGWFERADGMIQFSARSIGDVDVSVVAKHFGGGGHVHAAGFQLSLAEGRKIIDTILNRG